MISKLWCNLKPHSILDLTHRQWTSNRPCLFRHLLKKGRKLAGRGKKRCFKMLSVAKFHICLELRSLSEADCLHDVVGSPANRPKLNVAKDSKDHKHASLNGKSNDRCKPENLCRALTCRGNNVGYHFSSQGGHMESQKIMWILSVKLCIRSKLSGLMALMLRAGG